jgi:hypothetical protein
MRPESFFGMLQRLTDEQVDCLEHAARCRERASTANGLLDKESWLQMAAGWEVLADSYGLGVCLDAFGRSRKPREQN